MNSSNLVIYVILYIFIFLQLILLVLFLSNLPSLKELTVPELIDTLYNGKQEVTKPFVTTKGVFKVGIYISAFDNDLKDIQVLIPCIKNIVRAKDTFNAAIDSTEKLSIDLYVATNKQHIDIESNNDFREIYMESEDSPAFKLLRDFQGQLDHIYLQELDDVDTLPPFVWQLSKTVQYKRQYDAVLKLQTKAQSIIFNYALQCLCGTPMHVSSILRQFYENSKLSLLAPAGLTLTAHSDSSNIAPLLVNNFAEFQRSPLHVFDDTVLDGVNEIYSLLHPFDTSSERPMKEADLLVIAGTMYWARFSALNPKGIQLAMLKLISAEVYSSRDKLIPLYNLYHVYLPSSIKFNGETIKEILPAPKPIAIYFPQFHQFPENDRFWGEGFTEWTLLNKVTYPEIKFPLSEEKGGLGYYNLTSRAIRAKQAQIAKEYGVEGFMFYHYWFSGKQAPKHHKVMYKIPELMLLDGEPDIPFFFSWANEPWNRRWNGENNGEVLLSQDYGDATEWEEHFYYLLPFFKHRNYIRQDNKPLFAIYRVGHVGDALIPMLTLWNGLALSHGLSGMHFVNTLGGQYITEKAWNLIEKAPPTLMPASLHFWPGLYYYHPGCLTSKSHVRSLPVPTSVQYWGAMVGFDPRARGQNYYEFNPTPEEFRAQLQYSFTSMSTKDFGHGKDNYYFLNAWNEWNEQAILEPTHRYGFQMLESLRSNLLHFPAKSIELRGSINQDNGDTSRFKVAILVHFGVSPNQSEISPSKVAELIPCIRAVVEAKHFFNMAVKNESNLLVDIYISYLHTSTDEAFLNILEQEMSDFAGETDNIYYRLHARNDGLDILPFLEQLKATVSSNKNYDVILKLHSKSDSKWMNHGLQCLCGTPLQVASILVDFHRNPKLALISPSGMAFGPDFPVSQVSPYLLQKFPNLVKKTLWMTFLHTTVALMKKIHSILYPEESCLLDMEFNRGQLMVVAGMMFWARYSDLHPDKISSSINAFNFTTGYARDEKIEHAFERYFPTMMKFRGKEIREISPAPKPIAIYFPQFHQFPENDRFWGEGFTEWTLLKNASCPKLKHPLSEERGGLGYYNLTSRAIRAKQAQIAKEYGVQGFMFYHYWFSGKQAPKHHKVMYKIPELMLLDGEPDIPFFFSWANEPWNRRWTGMEDGEVLLSQDYGNSTEWEEHFYYLLPFFKHKNYIKIERRPAFAIYRIGHMKESLIPMLELWQRLAKRSGFRDGLFIINTLGGFYPYENTSALVTAAGDLIPASLHFWPGMNYNGPGLASKSHVTSVPVSTKMQYWGAMTGFDPTPRRKLPEEYRIFQSPSRFRAELNLSFASMGIREFSHGVDNYYFLTAWNEWNEQAILEPSRQLEFQMLEALRDSLLAFPSKPVTVAATVKT